MGDDELRSITSAGIAGAVIDGIVRGDTEAVLSLCSPDLRLHVEGFDDFVGHEGLRHLMEFQKEMIDGLRVEYRHVIASGDLAAVERTDTFEVGGEIVALDIGSFFTVCDGLVTEWYDYQDFRDVSRALGH